MKYDLEKYFQTGIKAEIKRMELKYGSDAVLQGITQYIEENTQEEQ